MDCTFCDIITRKTNAYFVYEDEMTIAIMDKHPYFLGHTLVIPKEHREEITDMTKEEASLLFSKIPFLARAIIGATNADGFIVTQNNGKVADETIPHVHVHIIPKYKDIAEKWPKRVPADDKVLEDISIKIKNHIKIV